MGVSCTKDKENKWMYTDFYDSTTKSNVTVIKSI